MSPQLDLDTLVLASGGHQTSKDAMCVMEAVAYLAGEPWTDSPQCASPVIGAFLRSWNDSLPDDDRQDLKRYIPRLVGSKGTDAQEEARSWMALDWLVRVQTPAWLRLAGLDAQAGILEGLGEVTADTCPSMLGPIKAVRQDASAAGDAAWAVAWAAAGDAARDAAWAAAWDAAWDAARDAAGDAAWAAAWDAARDAAGDAAWDATRDAAGDATRAAAGAAAWDAAWAAAGAAAWAAAGAAAGAATRAAAGAATRDAGGAATGPAAGAAAWDAAWAAAGAAAWAAAGAAAGAATRAAAGAATRDAAGDAAGDATRDAARDAAWDVAWDAARAALQPTVTQLQADAHQLVDRMLAVTETTTTEGNAA